MPLQNRVTPFNEIIRTPARGLFTGNRGCLHGANQDLIQRWTVRRWITCVLEYKGRTNPLMAPGKYTYLFFLDEATAFAAGHRPCAFCRYQDFKRFRALWLEANPHFPKGIIPSIDEVDNILQQERIGPAKAKVTYSDKLDNLPDGTFVTLDDPAKAYLVLKGGLFEWSPEGYRVKLEKPAATAVIVLTPKSIVRIFAAGYAPVIHPSANMPNY